MAICKETSELLLKLKKCILHAFGLKQKMKIKKYGSKLTEISYWKCFTKKLKIWIIQILKYLKKSNFDLKFFQKLKSIKKRHEKDGDCFLIAILV